MTLSTLGTPKNDTNAVIPTNEKASGWDEGRMNVSRSANRIIHDCRRKTHDETSLLAANFMYSTIYDLSAAGRAILKSLLLSPVSTNRWLKPISQTSNAADDVGVPFDIYRATLTGTSIGALTPIYTQFGTQGLYSSYFGLAPDWGVGFTILSADTTAPADLNAYVDLMVEHLLPALEKTAMQQAILNYAGRYTAGDVQLLIKVDGSSGLSLTNWTIGSQDIRAAFAELNSIPPATLDFRLYPTNLVNDAPYGGKRAFRAVLQDKAAPADAGTPTCITWMAGVDKFVFNGFSLDEFVFEIDQEGTATGVEVPALDLALRKK